MAEADALFAALLALLDRGMAIPSVIFALGKSMRSELVPRVTAELLKLVQGDGGFVIQQTIWTLSALLYHPPRGHLSRKQEVVFRNACAAIASVVSAAALSAGRSNVPDPREAAVATFMARREELRMAIAEAKHGPTRMWGGRVSA